MLDWQRIEELRAEIGVEDFAEVVEIFLDELEEVMGQIQAGGTPHETAERLHFLKGCALNLGFTGMAALAQDGNGNAEALADAYAQSREKFTAWFAEASAA